MSACAPSGTLCPCQTSYLNTVLLCMQRLAIVADLGITYDSATTLQHLMASNSSMAVLVGDLTCEANACCSCRALLSAVALTDAMRLDMPQHPLTTCLPACRC